MEQIKTDEAPNIPKTTDRKEEEVVTAEGAENEEKPCTPPSTSTNTKESIDPTTGPKAKHDGIEAPNRKRKFSVVEDTLLVIPKKQKRAESSVKGNDALPAAPRPMPSSWDKATTMLVKMAENGESWTAIRQALDKFEQETAMGTLPNRPQQGDATRLRIAKAYVEAQWETTADEAKWRMICHYPWSLSDELYSVKLLQEQWDEFEAAAAEAAKEHDIL